jgi:putative intracellular protease/amidase
MRIYPSHFLIGSKKMTALHIGLLLFRDVQQLDLTGPYEVFASLPGARVHLPASSLQPVKSSTGLMLTPTTSFGECPQLDVLCIPGGIGIDALLDDQATLDFVRHQALTARYVTSVCTGALRRIGARMICWRHSARCRFISVSCAMVISSPAVV